MTKRARFIVEVPVPEGATRAEVRDYIKEAVEMWSGQFDPDGKWFYFCNGVYSNADGPTKVTYCRPIKEPKK